MQLAVKTSFSSSLFQRKRINKIITSSFLSVLPYFNNNFLKHRDTLRFFQFFLISTSEVNGHKLPPNLSVLPYFNTKKRKRVGILVFFQFFLISTGSTHSYRDRNSPFQFFLISTSTTVTKWFMMLAFSSSLFQHQSDPANTYRWGLSVLPYFNVCKLVRSTTLRAFSSSLFQLNTPPREEIEKFLSVLPYFNQEDKQRHFRT